MFEFWHVNKQLESDRKVFGYLFDLIFYSHYDMRFNILSILDSDFSNQKSVLSLIILVVVGFEPSTSVSSQIILFFNVTRGDCATQFCHMIPQSNLAHFYSFLILKNNIFDTFENSNFSKAISPAVSEQVSAVSLVLFHKLFSETVNLKDK